MYQIEELAHLQLSLLRIKQATDSFSAQNFLGEGGFGKVYKGQLLPSNEVIAVKRLDQRYGQGRSEFLKEIVMLASYKHENIVSLHGFCDEDGEKLLVYKHEANGSLDKHLTNAELTWERRLQICLDAARGLKYLHEDVGTGHRVIHRDIKSSNILLDENWKAKISDFGLCKVGPKNVQFSFLVSDAAGTMGYLDPEYMTTGVLTKESDVYAFGLVLCEVLCGRLAMITSYNDERTFLSNLMRCHYKERTMEEIIFSNLRGHMKPYSLETFSRIAYNCVNNDRKHRPSMSIIVKELEDTINHQNAVEHPIDLEYQMDQQMLWGSTSSGDPWSFIVDKNQKIVKIIIDHRAWIHSISFVKRDLDGTLHYSPTYGGSNNPKLGKLSEINFEDYEDITGMSVTVGKHVDHILVSSVCFMTTKRNYGPFGTEAHKSFTKSWDVGTFAGFCGRSGWELDAIGCCFWNVL